MLSAIPRSYRQNAAILSGIIFWCHLGVTSLKHIFCYWIEMFFSKKKCADISTSRRKCWQKEFVAKCHPAELSVKCRVFVRHFGYFSDLHGGRTTANGGHPCGLRAAGMWPANAKTSPAVVGGHGVMAGRVLRCDTNSRLFRSTQPARSRAQPAREYARKKRVIQRRNTEQEQGG